MPNKERLPRTVKLFGTVSLFNDFASEMIYPLLPAFFTSVLGAGAAALGTLDGAAEFSSAVVKYVAGKLSDRAERRGTLVVAGYGAAIVVRPLIAFTQAAWQVIGLRVVDRLGKGLRTPPRDAIIADATPPGLRGRAFGLHRGMDHAGAILGPLAAWYLLAVHHLDLRHIIAASIVPGVIALALAIWATWDWKRREGEGAREGGGKSPGQPEANQSERAAEMSDSERRTLFAAIGIFYFIRMPETLLILRSQELGVAVALVPLLWAGVHVFKSVLSFVAGSWTDRSGPVRPMWVGWVCYAVLAAGMGLARTALGAWILFLLLGSVWGLTESPERAVVARVARARLGSGYGAFHAATGIAALLGGIVLGSLYQHVGATPVFLGSAAAGAVLVGAYLLTGGSARRRIAGS